MANMLGIKYLELEKNIGRSAIRNLLGRIAEFDTLLFLDCDSVIDNDDFLLKYTPYFGIEMVVYGGTSYQAFKPPEEFRLHWNYGRKREIKPASDRNKFPTRYFKTNNFLIHKSILQKYPFEEDLKGYGHEDTLFGVILCQNGIKVIHIENTILHAGLETNSIFLQKTEEGLKNLCKIKNGFVEKDLLCKHVYILDVFNRIEKLGIKPIVRVVWLISKPLLLVLIKKFNSIQSLNFYKLGYLCAVCK
jgi:hypothetical protein